MSGLFKSFGVQGQVEAGLERVTKYPPPSKRSEKRCA